MTASAYDAIVIGSGQGGGPLARALAGDGRRTAIVERVHVDGTCINEGCTPTKTMVASARVAYLARRGADYGVGTGPVTVDMVRVRERKRAIVESFRSAGERRFAATDGLDLLMGRATLTGPGAVEVVMNDGGSHRELTSELIVLNTGDRPAVPPLEGLRGVPFLDSTSIMELDAVPDHLVVLGGGYVGLEFAQMFRRFGAGVTIVQRGPSLAPREDRDVADAVAAIMREDGIEVLLDATATRVEALPARGVRLHVAAGGEERAIDGSHLLVATGRVANTDGLGLETAGVEVDRRGYVRVDDHLRTSAPGVYAIGDMKGGPAFTHISYDDFRILRANLIDGGDASITGRVVPYTMFIDPQLGRVGLSETEARAEGRDVRVARMPMSYVARALEVDESRGFMKAVVDAGSGRILGAAVLGLEGGEIMAMLEMAMLGGLPYTVLRDAVFAHPTLAESLNNLFSSFEEA